MGNRSAIRIEGETWGYAPRLPVLPVKLGRLADFENGNRFDIAELLRELEENRENRPFLDKIHHQTGEFYRIQGTDSLAIAYYNKSLRTNSRDKFLKAKNYETLGDMYFDGSVYADAGNYYDSTMNSMTLNTKPYRLIKKKRDNLKDVIYYESIAKVNDSVLRLVNLSEAECLTYFEGFVEQLKIKAEEEKAPEAIKEDVAIEYSPEIQQAQERAQRYF